MSTIDIRGANESPVDKIVFADVGYQNYGTQLKYVHGEIVLQADDTGEYESIVISKTTVENLIKSLQKAIDLGWTKGEI